MMGGIGHRDRTGAATPRNRAGGNSIMAMHEGPPSMEKIQRDKEKRDHYRFVLEQQIREKKERDVKSREAREGIGEDNRLPWQQDALDENNLEPGWEIGPLGLPVRSSSPSKLMSPGKGRNRSNSHSPGGRGRRNNPTNIFSDPLKVAQEERDIERKKAEQNYKQQIEEQIRDKEEEARRRKEEEEEEDRREAEKLRREEQDIKKVHEEEEEAARAKKEAELIAQRERDAEAHKIARMKEAKRLKDLDIQAELKAKREIDEMNRQLEIEKGGVATGLSESNLLHESTNAMPTPPLQVSHENSVPHLYDHSFILTFHPFIPTSVKQVEGFIRQRQRFPYRKQCSYSRFQLLNPHSETCTTTSSKKFNEKADAQRH